MIEGIRYDKRPVDRIFQAVDADGNKHHQVCVYYADELEPKSEVMSEDEWNAMQQEEDDVADRLRYLQDATYNLRKKVMVEFEKHNPRLVDTKRIITRIEDDMVSQLVTALYNLAFNKTDYVTELGMGDVLETYKTLEKLPDFGDLDEKEKVVMQCVAEQNFPIEFLVELGRRLEAQARTMRDHAIGEIVGIPLANIRIDDLIQFMEKKLKERKATEG